MRQLLTHCIVCLFGIFICFSQEGKPKMTEEEFHQMRYGIEKIQTSNKDSLLVLVEDLMKVAHSFKDNRILTRALLTKANIEVKVLDQDHAIATLNEALKINGSRNNTVELALIYNDLGSCNYRKANYVESTKNFLKSVKISKNIDSIITGSAYIGLSDVCIAQHNIQDALKYALLAKKYESKNTGENVIASNALAIGNAYEELNEIEKAEDYFNEAARLFKKIGDNFYVAYTYYEHAGLYFDTDPLKSIDYRLEAQAIFDKVAPDRLSSGSNMDFLGEEYVLLAANDSLIKKIKNPLVPKTKAALLAQAEILYNKALPIAIKNNNVLGILSTREYLSQVQELTGNYKDAYANLVVAKRLRDSLFSQENKNEIAKLMSEKEVFELKTANEKKTNLNKILIGSSIALLLIAFLIYWNFKNKRRVQNLKITELEKDKQLLTVDAMLKGQEEERSRIAKDLHDGLGGLLSGTKLSFINMKENLILTPENAIQFDKSLNMLDSTIVDLRKVAQNLMPEALVKFGLNEALRDYCNGLQSSSKITVIYQKIGIDRKLPNTAEVFVYRIIQELINNAVKHSKASEIIVQLALSETKTSITVEDNGLGYDKNTIENKEGSGLDNIAYRVHYLNGAIDTETSLNNGTSVNIELNV